MKPSAKLFLTNSVGSISEYHISEVWFLSFFLSSSGHFGRVMEMINYEVEELKKVGAIEIISSRVYIGVRI